MCIASRIRFANLDYMEYRQFAAAAAAAATGVCDSVSRGVYTGSGRVAPTQRLRAAVS